MQRTSARAAEDSSALYATPHCRMSPAGLNEATWAAAARQLRVGPAPASIAELRQRLKHDWIVSVTALAGQRRSI
jgi:hypothetical protein